MKFQLLFQQLQVFLVLLALFADDLVESESFPLLLADVEDDALHQVLQLPDQPLAALALLQLFVEPVQVGRTCNHSKKKKSVAYSILNGSQSSKSEAVRFKRHIYTPLRRELIQLVDSLTQ